MKYSYGTVGENAGKVWKALIDNGALAVTKIEEATGLKKDDVLVALGWLLRESKIDSVEEKRSIKFFLK